MTLSETQSTYEPPEHIHSKMAVLKIALNLNRR
jgi:hypothetical protein